MTGSWLSLLVATAVYLILWWLARYSGYYKSSFIAALLVYICLLGALSGLILLANNYIFSAFLVMSIALGIAGGIASYIEDKNRK